MQMRTVVAMLAGLVAISIIGFLAHTPRRSTPPRRRSSVRVGPGPTTPGIPLAVIPDTNIIGRYTATAGQPRLVANLADQVGQIVVSVRQVYASDRVRNLYDDARQAGPIGVWQLILQSNVRQSAGPSGGLGDADVYDITATDDRGTVMSVVEPSSAIGGSTPMPGGRSHSVFLSAPHPEATVLASVAGSIRRMGGNAETAPSGFTIRNVPLPGSPRLFGEITPMRLSDAAAAAGIPGPLYGEDMEKALRGATQHPECSDLPYLRLVLPVGIETDVQAVLPAGSRALKIAASPQGIGHCAASGSVGSVAWRTLTWDREPFLLILSARTASPKIGVRISLSRTDETVTLPGARSVFAGESRTPAGSIVVRFAVRGRPLGPAVVPVTVYRREGSTWTNGETTEAPIRANGESILANLRPGTYRLRFHAERITPLAVSGRITLERYLIERYQAPFGSWNEAAEQQIEVLPAGRAYGKTVRFVPRARP